MRVMSHRYTNTFTYRVPNAAKDTHNFCDGIRFTRQDSIFFVAIDYTVRKNRILHCQEKFLDDFRNGRGTISLPCATDFAALCQ